MFPFLPVQGHVAQVTLSKDLCLWTGPGTGPNLPPMLRYILKRLTSLVVSLAVASAVIFCVIEVVPGDPASYMLGMNAQPDTVAALRADLGLDQPRVERYFAWIGGMMTGCSGAVAGCSGAGLARVSLAPYEDGVWNLKEALTIRSCIWTKKHRRRPQGPCSGSSFFDSNRGYW